MRIGRLIAVSAAMAALGLGSLCFGANARAATMEKTSEPDGPLARLAAGLSDLFSPGAAGDGPVYGVRARSDLAAAEQGELRHWTVPSDNAIVAVDAAGRAFAGAEGSGVYTSGLADFDNLFFSDTFQSYRPFADAVQTGFGTVAASGYAVTTTTPALLAGGYGIADRKRYDLRDFQLSATLMPGVRVNAGYNLDLAGRLNGYDTLGSRAYDGLFLLASAVNSPYLSLSDGGNYLGASLQLTDDLALQFGAVSLDPQRPGFEGPIFAMLDGLQRPHRAFDLRRAWATEASLSWDFARWGGLGLTASQTTEHNAILGTVNPGALSMAKSAKTSAVGLSARFGFGDGWVTTFSYNEGITQLDLRPAGLVSSADTLRSRAYGVAVAKHGLFSNSDSLGVALSRPVQVYDGAVDLARAGGAEVNRGLEHVSLAGKTPETDVELGYVTTFFDGALALQANAGYQMNFAGQSGTNALTVLSRAKFNF